MSKSIKGVEIFATGKWKGRDFTEKSLDSMVKAFDFTGFMPPLKLGHSEGQRILQKDGLPAAGWVEKIYRKGKKLMANFKDIPDKIASAIKKGAYRQISSEIYFNYPIDGQVFETVLRAVALLGADNPAVPVLNPIDPLALYRTKDSMEYAIYTTNIDVNNFEIEGDKEGSRFECSADDENNSTYIDFTNLLLFAGEGIKFIIGRLKGKTGTTVQSVLFDKNKWTESAARTWLKEHSMSTEKIDVTENNLRFRQKEPGDFDRLRTIVPGNQPNNSRTKDNKMDTNENTNKETIEEKKKKKGLLPDDIEILSDELQEKLDIITQDFEAKLEAKDKILQEYTSKLAKSEMDRKFEKVREVVNTFIQDGKILPKHDAKVYTLLTGLVTTQSEPIKFTEVDGKEQESTLYDIAINLIKDLPISVDFTEQAKKTKDNLDSRNPDVILDQRIKEYLNKNNMGMDRYSEAMSTVLKSDPDLAQAYRMNFSRG